jgi:dipeptidyl aminopeptidase/acylaminoacyl peptidase
MRQAIICAVALFTDASMAEAAAPTAPIPIESFTRHDEYGAIKISPDGKSLALAMGKYGRTAVVFFDLESKKTTSGVRTPEGFEIDDFQWISPTRLIYTVAERSPGEVQPSPTGEMFAVNRDGTRHLMIYGYRAGGSSTGTHLKGRQSSYAHADLISSLRRDDKDILLAEYQWRTTAYGWRYDPDVKPRIIRLDTYSGSKRTLGGSPLSGGSLLADRDDEVRFALGRDAKLKLAVNWMPKSGDAWTEFSLPGFREESVLPQLFSADNHSVLFTGVREGETLAALYRLDLETQAIERVHAFDNAEITDVITDLSESEIVGVRGYAERPVYHWLADNPATSLYRGLQRAFPDQNVTITSATDDGRLAIAFVSSDVNPGDYYLFDTTTKKAEYVRGMRSWIDPKLMRPIQPIELTARDGMKLHGYLTRPAGDGPAPMIVLPHGGPHGVRDVWAFDSEVQLLANRGYAVLQVNFRGSGGYGIDFEAAGYRAWGTTMQDDVTDATRWAIDKGYARSDRICIYGGSYGGYAALMGAVREPKLYRCVIGHAGVYDLELMLSSADIPKSRSGRAYLDDVLGHDPADLHARSPTYNAQLIEAPVLLIHGKEDWRADYEQAKRMKAALEKKGKQVDWLALGGEGHGVYDEDTRKEVYTRILAFLDQHLKADVPTAASP